MNKIIMASDENGSAEISSVINQHAITGSADGEVSESTAAPMLNQPKPAFLEPDSLPTQEGPGGIRYDFNFGCRVFSPSCDDGVSWTVRLSDTLTGNVIFESTMPSGGSIQSTKKFYVPFKLECWKGCELVFTHTLDCRNKDVLIQVPVGTLGDAIAWFPYIDAFQKKHECQLTCLISSPLKALFESRYPNIQFVEQNVALAQNKFYATYRLGLFFDDTECVNQPVDFRYVGLHKTAAYILGVDPIESPPRVAFSTKKRLIKEPYVCIAVQSSTLCKYWNNPHGWIEIVAWLKEVGYRVLCIDKEKVWGQGMAWTSIPNGAEDFTGNLPLAERAALLRDADFFVGLSSGLAWLAWAAGTPVVMISGFTHPNNEFYTPHRVFNYHTCNSCWNDPRVMFDHYDFFWCPRHKGTDRQYECTRLITINHVKELIQSVPAFQKVVKVLN